MARKFDIDKFNNVLIQNGQRLRALCIDGSKIELNNGVILQNASDVRKCKRRVMNNQELFLDNFDKIYQTDRVEGARIEKEVRRLTSRKGGVICQKKHSKKIRNNLSGQGWNKGKKLHYDVWNKGLTKDTDERLQKLSHDRSGVNNPMFGHRHSDDYKREQSQRMKNLILSGDFTPNSNNSNTHWDSSFNGKRYRSSWEAIFQAHYLEAEYETLRIPYYHDGNEYIYIVDFVDHQKKIAVEVKPTNMLKESKTTAKLTALEKWCQNNGYNMLIADEKYLKALGIPELSLFDDGTKEKVKKLYEIS